MAQEMYMYMWSVYTICDQVHITACGTTTVNHLSKTSFVDGQTNGLAS